MIVFWLLNQCKSQIILCAHVWGCTPIGFCGVQRWKWREAKRNSGWHVDIKRMCPHQELEMSFWEERCVCALLETPSSSTAPFDVRRLDIIYTQINTRTFSSGTISNRHCAACVCAMCNYLRVRVSMRENGCLQHGAPPAVKSLQRRFVLWLTRLWATRENLMWCCALR